MSIMVGPKFSRVQTELETNLGHISSSGLNRGTDRGLESKSDQSQLNARKPGFADLYGGLRHWITCQRASHCSTMQLCHCSLGPSCQQPHFNINECQLLTIRHYHSARIFGAHCESQAAAPQLCENPVGGKRGGTKEAAPLWTIMPCLRNYYWIKAP